MAPLQCAIRKSPRFAAANALNDERVVKLFEEGGAIAVTCKFTADMKIIIPPMSGEPRPFQIACAVCKTSLDPHPWTQLDASGKWIFYESLLWTWSVDTMLGWQKKLARDPAGPRRSATEESNLIAYRAREDQEYMKYWNPPSADRERLELAYAAEYVASHCECGPARGDGPFCCQTRFSMKID